ncbi:MAG: hypothetical protein D6798_19290 [Deltaproteobacteria bacterium]|nr:MAG: hypothetical protein D6798_19290 [Deltaproteobacteria bacterium]
MTDAERAAVEALQRSLQAEIQAATTRLGRPPALDELEGSDDQGQPLLAGGVPDNPLLPGVAGVRARCPAVPRAGDRVDWIYCPDSGTVRAVGLP